MIGSIFTIRFFYGWIETKTTQYFILTIRFIFRLDKNQINNKIHLGIRYWLDLVSSWLFSNQNIWFFQDFIWLSTVKHLILFYKSRFCLCFCIVLFHPFWTHAPAISVGVDELKCASLLKLLVPRTSVNQSLFLFWWLLRQAAWYFALFTMLTWLHLIPFIILLDIVFNSD